MGETTWREQAEAALVSAHLTMVEWYVQDQGEFLGVVGAIGAAHREVAAIQEIDRVLERCPERAASGEGEPFRQGF
mgnify:CR=1 FL=1